MMKNGIWTGALLATVLGAACTPRSEVATKGVEGLVAAGPAVAKLGVAFYDPSDAHRGKVALLDASREVAGAVTFSEPSELQRTVEVRLGALGQRLEYERPSTDVEFPTHYGSLDDLAVAIVADGALSPMARRYRVVAKESHARPAGQVLHPEETPTCNTNAGLCYQHTSATCSTANVYSVDEPTSTTYEGACIGACAGMGFAGTESQTWGWVSDEFGPYWGPWFCTCNELYNQLDMVNHCLTAASSGCSSPGQLDRFDFRRKCVASATSGTCTSLVTNLSCEGCTGSYSSTSTNQNMCPRVNKVCNTSTGNCGCNSDSDCTGTGTVGSATNPKPYCDTSAHTCTRCRSNSDCGGNTPYCTLGSDPSGNACSGSPCSTNADCGGSTPFCYHNGFSGNSCTACLTNADCSGGDVCGDFLKSCGPCVEYCMGVTCGCF